MAVRKNSSKTAKVKKSGAKSSASKKRAEVSKRTPAKKAPAKKVASKKAKTTKPVKQKKTTAAPAKKVMSLRLSNLGPNFGAREGKKRLGRGEGSGIGKTSGRGGKGQTARTGGTINRHFEGGQMPLYRRIPKIGFTSRSQAKGWKRRIEVSLNDLQRLISTGVVKEGDVIAADMFGNRPVKLLASGEIKAKVNVRVHAVSKKAKEAVEAAGGRVELISDTALS